MPVAIAVATVAMPAAAQVAGSATISNDYLFRDTSIAQGHPTIQGTLSYDDASGAYASASIIGAQTGGGASLLSVEGNVGYARRLGSIVAPVLDLGVVHAEYRNLADGGATRYDEAYIGILTPHLSSHLYVSPDYFRPGTVTVYGDVETVIRPTSRLRLTFHLGLLEQVAGPRIVAEAPTRYDVQVGIGQRLGSVDLGLALATGGPDVDYYGGRVRTRNHAVVHATFVF